MNTRKITAAVGMLLVPVGIMALVWYSSAGNALSSSNGATPTHGKTREKRFPTRNPTEVAHTAQFAASVKILLRQQGNIIAQGRNTASGKSINSYRIEEVVLPGFTQLTIGSQEITIDRFWRLIVSRDEPLYVGANEWYIWLDDDRLGAYVDGSELKMYTFDKTVLREGAIIGASYGLALPDRKDAPLTIHFSSASANSEGQGSQSVTPVRTVTPYASSPEPTKPENWLPTISASNEATPTHGKTREQWPRPTPNATQIAGWDQAARTEDILFEQQGTIIAQGQDTSANADPQSYQVEEVTLAEPTSMHIDGKDVLVEKVWRVIVSKREPIYMGANDWYIWLDDVPIRAGVRRSTIIAFVLDRSILKEGSRVQVSYGLYPPQQKNGSTLTLEFNK